MIERLRAAGLTLAVAESCTGGLLGARLTDVAGSSDVFLGGVIAYANAAKKDLLGVPQPVLNRHGAVSAPVARAMAQGASRRFRARCALAVTGIAGPGGGTPAKPVGLVFVSAYGPAGSGRVPAVTVRRFRFRGDRSAIRLQSVDAALALLGAVLAVPGRNRRRAPAAPGRPGGPRGHRS